MKTYRSLPRAFLLLGATLLLAMPVGAHGRSRGGGHRGGGHHGGRGSHFGVSVALGFGSYLGYWPGIAYHVYRPVYVPQPVQVRAPIYASSATVGASYGTIETDVDPDSATVYLDGVAVGVADDFDGSPGKLTVTPGRHEIAFREVGYQQLRVVVDVLPFHNFEINERLRRGEDIVPPSLDTSSGSVGAAPPVQSDRDALLALAVTPADATVYVDGRSQDGPRAAGRLLIAITPGSHRIEVVKAGYEVFSGEVVGRVGQRQELDVRLTARGN